MMRYIPCEPDNSIPNRYRVFFGVADQSMEDLRGCRNEDDIHDGSITHATRTGFGYGGDVLWIGSNQRILTLSVMGLGYHDSIMLLDTLDFPYGDIVFLMKPHDFITVCRLGLIHHGQVARMKYGFVRNGVRISLAPVIDE